MEDIYDRIIVKGVEIAYGPDFPGPECNFYYHTIFKHENFYFILFDGIWYKVHSDINDMINMLTLSNSKYYIENLFNAWIAVGTITSLNFPIE